MNKWLELLIGVVFLIAAIVAWGYNLAGLGSAALNFLKGGLMWVVIILGVVFITLGINDLKE
ncbi:MAG TPA: hypothetical protein VJ912_00795 [Candidatus Nanoarchaeia archaeon]|nr:hypothetical protein [Candidatus Nanoarchaeia archaeon]